MTDPIKFGTDGWRGIIADDFTFDNVRRVAAAIAAYVLKHEDAGRGLVVGYDTRFCFARFARPRPKCSREPAFRSSWPTITPPPRPFLLR